MSRPKIAAVIVVLLVVTLGLLSRHRANAALATQTDAQTVTPVTVIRPKSGSQAIELTLPGNIEAAEEASIYARTSGYLKKWYVDIGAEVKEGQLLAEIDAPEVDQQLHQAQADLANAVAANQIAQLTATRWKDLRESDSVSKQEADEKISIAAASAAAVKAAEANLQRLRELAGFKRIVAPFDGIVTARNTDIGQLITAGGGSGPELFRVAAVNLLRLYVKVPQSYAAAMTPGTEARVVFPDRPGMSFASKLVATSNAIDVTTRTLLAQLMVDNSKRDLLPGSYAEVHFNLPARAVSALRVPANTLLSRGDGLSLATVDANNRVRLKHIQLGRDFGSEIEIIGGIAPEDRVIVSPSDSLVNSQRVQIVTPGNSDKLPQTSQSTS